MKFRKKPVIIHADLFHEDGPAIDGVAYEEQDVFGIKIRKYFVKTLEGIMHVKNGDWIITGVKGEKYPCNPEIFELTYERVDDEQS